MTLNPGKLLVDNKAIDLPVKEGTIGPSVVDIGKMYAQTGLFTYDPGFTSTASCESKITYIDGDEGVLLYRGYPIEQLAEHGGLSRELLPSALRRAAHQGPEGRVRLYDHAPHDGA